MTLVFFLGILLDSIIDLLKQTEGIADFQALSEFLADKPFLMGNEPTSRDAAVYAPVGNVIQPPLNSPIAEYIAEYVLQLPDLCHHYARMTQQCF